MQKHSVLKEKKRLANEHETQSDVISTDRRTFIRSLSAAWKQTPPGGCAQSSAPWAGAEAHLHRSPTPILQDPFPAFLFQWPALSLLYLASQNSRTFSQEASAQLDLVNTVISPTLHPEYPSFKTFREKHCDWRWVLQQTTKPNKNRNSPISRHNWSSLILVNYPMSLNTIA